MHAVILAGGKVDNHMDQPKATIMLKGKPMITYVVDALKNASLVEKIIVIGNIEELEPILGSRVDLIIEEKKSIIDNVMEAASLFKDEPRILIATCDIPLLKGENVEQFIKAGLNHEAELFYPIVEKKVCEKAYPDLKRTYVTLKDGVFTGGNLFILKPPVMRKVGDIAHLMIESRKNPIKMCRILGLIFVFKLIFKQLTIKQLEKYIQMKFGMIGKAYISLAPEICNDLDRLEELNKVESYL